LTSLANNHFQSTKHAIILIFYSGISLRSTCLAAATPPKAGKPRQSLNLGQSLQIRCQFFLRNVKKGSFDIFAIATVAFF